MCSTLLLVELFVTLAVNLMHRHRCDVSDSIIISFDVREPKWCVFITKIKALIQPL